MQKILVIDDNPINLKLVCSLLEAEGYFVCPAVNAEEALTLLEKSSFAMILTDIELPGMDGLAFTRAIKQNPKTQKTIVIAVTAFAMVGDEEKAVAAGCDGYIAKPIDTRKLPLYVARFLNEQGSRL